RECFYRQLSDISLVKMRQRSSGTSKTTLTQRCAAMKRIAPFIALVILSGCNMRGCNPLVKLVNEKFPPVDPSGQELAAVQTATAQLDQLSSALVYVAISAAALN